MSTICYYSVPLYGHLNPVLPVLAALIARGERVIAYNTERYRAAFERVGAAFRPYPDGAQIEAALPNTTNINFFLTTLRLLDLYPSLLPFAREQTASERPAVITHDMMGGWAKIAAAEAGTPALMFVPSVYQTSAMGARILPKALMARTLVQYARLALPIMQTQGRVERELGLARGTLGSPLTNAEAHNVAFTARELQPFPDSLGFNVTFGGMPLSDRVDQLDFALDDARPIIYIALGTITTDNRALYKACFDAFGEVDAQVVLSVGRDTDPASLGAIPPNFIVRPFIAQLEILKRASLFVSHGGSNSVYESLQFGVPLIIVPTAVDPLLVAYRVVQEGAAVMIRPTHPLGGATAPELRAAHDRIMADRAGYARVAARLGDALRATGGAGRAADVIQGLA
jgi:MGT family glycosyltransferase